MWKPSKRNLRKEERNQITRDTNSKLHFLCGRRCSLAVTWDSNEWFCWVGVIIAQVTYTHLIGVNTQQQLFQMRVPNPVHKNWNHEGFVQRTIAYSALLSSSPSVRIMGATKQLFAGICLDLFLVPCQHFCKLPWSSNQDQMFWELQQSPHCAQGTSCIAVCTARHQNWTVTVCCLAGGHAFCCSLHRMRTWVWSWAAAVDKMGIRTSSFVIEYETRSFLLPLLPCLLNATLPSETLFWTKGKDDSPLFLWLNDMIVAQITPMCVLIAENNSPFVVEFWHMIVSATWWRRETHTFLAGN